jgi:hypothetical protein
VNNKATRDAPSTRALPPASDSLALTLPEGISSRRRTILASPAARTKCEPSLRLAGQDAGHHDICPPNLADAALKTNRGAGKSGPARAKPGSDWTCSVPHVVSHNRPVNRSVSLLSVPLSGRAYPMPRMRRRSRDPRRLAPVGVSRAGGQLH